MLQTLSTTDEEYQQALTTLKARENWKADPLLCSQTFFDTTLWKKQEEILQAYHDYNKVVIKSGNTIGKSHIASEIALIHLLSYQPSMVLTTAPTFSQVEDVIWREIRNLYFKAKLPIGGNLLETELTFAPNWFARGISTNNLQRFQGRHNPHLLVIIDEGSGVDDEIWDAIDSLHPEKILALGNPLFDYGRFYKAFHADNWHKISISCRECVKWQKENFKIPGLVTQEWIDEQIEFHGVNSDYVAIHVDGEFPEQSENTLISRAWVERARKGLDANNKPIDDENEEDSVRIISNDVATKHGANSTVIGYRYGHTFKEFAGFYRIPLTKTRDKLLFRFNRYAFAGSLPKIVIDSDGVGEGLGDMLTEENVPHLEFHGGYRQQAMDTQKYANLRTQFYCVVAKKFEKGFYNLKHLDDKTFEILKSQLCSIKVKPNDGLGRIQIETKEDMLARSVESPDYADSFMMSEFAFFMSNISDIKPYSYR